MITLHTLGDAVITVGDREVRPTSPIMFAALLYLGVERGQRVPRAVLQGLLFPKASERSGAHSLRQLLYKLRQLGAPIQTDGDVVSLPSAAVSDDYSANGNGSAPHTRARFLDIYAPHVSDAFDEWLDRKRAQIGAGLRRTLAAQMAARRGVADWASVERLAHEILASDAFNEAATYALAEATAVSGSKSEAVRMLERYESETGRSDLKLSASILRRRISERLPESRRRPLDTPFVGREPEAEAMRQAVLHLRGGSAGSAVIVGEPGIGKSRLLEETSALAILEGVNVQVVRCQPHYGSRPMGVFIELVPALMASRGALGVAPETLAHLTLLTSHRDDRANRPTDARDDATRSGTLLAAVRDLVDAVAGEAPLLVAVEDAHWADPTSLIELSALVTGARGRALLVVYTTRQLEPLKQLGVVTDSTPVVRLKPLAAAPMKRLSGHLLPSVAKNVSADSEGDVAGWCAQTAAGNPFYLQVLCAHYEDTRQPFTVPPDMRSATTRRIELLPKDCRRVLELTALLGRHASLEGMQALSGLRGLAFVDAVQFLEEEGYLRMQAGSARLAHDLMSECLLELLQPLTLAVLHGRVAADLEARYEQSHDAALLWECAQHWALSGEVGKALRFVLRCAQHAILIGQSARALRFLEGAVGFATTEKDQVQLLRETIFAARAAYDWEAALRLSRKLGSLPEGASLVTEHTDIELIALDADWRVNLKPTPFVDRLLDCTTAPKATADHRADAAFTLFRIAFERGDKALATRAYASVEQFLGGDSASYSRRLLPLAFLSSYGDKERALRLARELRAQLHTFDETERFGAAHNIGVALCFLGAADESLALYEEFFRRARTLELPEWTVDFSLNVCWVHICAEDFAKARHWYALAKELVDEGRAMGSRARYLAQGTYLAFDAGRTEDARALLDGFSNCCGESLRNRAFLSFSSLKLDLLDPNYVCSDDVIAELDAQFEAIKALAGMDTLVLTWFDALSRRGFRGRGAAVVRDYLDSSRLERSALPPSLSRLALAIDNLSAAEEVTEGP